MYKYSIALRYLVSRRIAYISIVAIAFGVMAMIVVSSVMDGFQKRIHESIRSIDSPLSVRADDYWTVSGPEHFERVKAALEPWSSANGGPVIALSKRVYEFGLATRRAYLDREPVTLSKAVQMIGVDIELEREVVPWEQMLDAVRMDFRRVPDTAEQRAEPFVYRDERGLPRAEPGIVLGLYLASDLRVGRGDLVTVTFARVDPADPSKIEPISERFIVTGCFKCGRYDYDKLTAFCDGQVIQSILNRANDCDRVAVALKDPESAESVKNDIREVRNPRLEAETWLDQMGTLALSLDMEKGILLVIMSIIVLVAGASICGILYMLVLEKTRDIGILMAMGSTSGGITAIFLLYGGILGFVGAGLGVFLGVEFVANLNELAEFMDVRLGLQVFPPEIYQFDQVPSETDPQSVLVMAGGAFAASLIASLVPAFRASRLDPVRCLAYE